MNFLALNDDVKFIISNHLAPDLKISAYVRMACAADYGCTYVCMYIRKYVHIHCALINPPTLPAYDLAILHRERDPPDPPGGTLVTPSTKFPITLHRFF